MNEENKRLTAAEKKHIPFYLEKWQNIALKSEFSGQYEVKEAVNRFYQFNDLGEPNILFFDSPWGAIEHLLQEDNTIHLRTAIDNLLALSQLKSQVFYENYDPNDEFNNLDNNQLEIELKQFLSVPILTLIHDFLESSKSLQLRLEFNRLKSLEREVEQQLDRDYYIGIVNELLKNGLTKDTFIELITKPQSITRIHPEIIETWQEIVSRYDLPQFDRNKLKLIKIHEIENLISDRVTQYKRNVFCQKLAADCAIIDFKISVLNYPFDLEKWKILETLVTNLSWIFPFEETCLVCARPSKILLDSQKRLHAEGESAIEFADGWLKKYYYHGDPIPEKYGQIHPSQWKSEWILSEKNAHLRGVLIREIGYLRICEELKSESLDRWKEYELIKIEEDIEPEPNGFNIEIILLIKMTCPSTNKIHVLRVPPNMTSARVAIKWVNWGIDPEDFSIQT